MKKHILPFQRWYERQPRLSQSVKVLQMMPDAIKSILADAIMLIATREFGKEEPLNVIRSLGSEKIMGLHKSKNKRREYDQNELLHKAMNYLYILSEEKQDFMAEHALKMLHYIQDYLAACQEFQVDSSIEEVAALAKTYVEQGSVEVEIFLRKLRKEFYIQLQNSGKLSEPRRAVDFLKSINARHDEHGMRVIRAE
jgi:hypothetical protein